MVVKCLRDSKFEIITMLSIQSLLFFLLLYLLQFFWVNPNYLPLPNSVHGSFPTYRTSLTSSYTLPAPTHPLRRSYSDFIFVPQIG